MDVKLRGSYISSLCILVMISSHPLCVHSLCKRKPVIFNFGDSTSDTGGYFLTRGVIPEPLKNRTIDPQLLGRYCDGRVLLDFYSEKVGASYLTPYLESLEPNFRNGVNFAVSSSSIHPRYIRFNLHIQVLQFSRFKIRSIESVSRGAQNLVGRDEFANALYIIDIGENDIDADLSLLPFAQAIDGFSSYIDEIEDAIWTLYEEGARNFWVHNMGPIGCLPRVVAAKQMQPGDADKVGCLRKVNAGVQMYNDKLRALCEELRYAMPEATIVYVDIYAIKYEILSNAAKYGFGHPLVACCGYGGPPYNFIPEVQCTQPGYTVCPEGSRYIFWDGNHPSQAANQLASSLVFSTNYSTPPINFDFFCDK